MAERIYISNIGVQSGPAGQRACAEINGHELWFETGDASLVARAEGFVAAMLLTAMAQSKRLVVDAPLDRRFLENITDLMDTYTRWWGYSPVAIDCSFTTDHPARSQGGTGLCFSAGVDSFYSLRTYGTSPITHLINIHGYDIPLEDETRYREIASSLRITASEVGVTAVLMRSNIRQHPVFSVPWPYSHGGALVAAAYMVGGIDRLVISASYPYAYERPWGSHWETDPLWSSGTLQVCHYGADLWRTEKLLSLQDDPLVQKHLRVCWEFKNSSANCCACEKCLRTILALQQCDSLHAFETFDVTDLPALLDALDHVGDFALPVYRRYMAKADSPELKGALARLIRRSVVEQDAGRRERPVGPMPSFLQGAMKRLCRLCAGTAKASEGA